MALLCDYGRAKPGALDAVFSAQSERDKGNYDAAIVFYEKASVLSDCGCCRMAIRRCISECRAKKSGGCYIATCVYGSYDCPEVWTLRRFRDNTLSQSILGRWGVRIYYAVSPRVVRWLGNNKWFHRLWMPVLNKFVCHLQHIGVCSTPYQDEHENIHR